ALALLGLANSLDGGDLIRSREQAALNRDFFDFAIAADRFTTALDPTLIDMRYWFDNNEAIDAQRTGPPLRYVFNSYVAIHGGMINLFGGWPPPAPEAVETKHLGTFR